jgi:branched-chain amino acid transport system permease protein
MTFTGRDRRRGAVPSRPFRPSIVVDTLVTGGMWALMAGGLALVFGVMNIPKLFMIGSRAFTVLGRSRGVPRTVRPPSRSAVPPRDIAARRGLRLAPVECSPPSARRAQWVMNVPAHRGIPCADQRQPAPVRNDFRGITRYWDVPPIEIMGVPVSVDRGMVFVIAMAMIALFAVFLQRTRTGRAMRAVSQDETGAQMAGIGLNQVFVLTMGLSCALAALAGAALLFMFPSFPDVGIQPLYLAWYVVILAGLGNVQGAIIGAFIVALLQTLAVYYVGLGWVDVLPTGFIILILLFKPSGLFGSEVKGVWEQ